MASFETGYRSTLSAKLNATDITLSVATAPTITAGRMHIYRGNTHAWIKYTGVSGTTLTGVTFVSQTADPATTVTGVTFPAGTSIELVEMHDQMIDKQTGSKVKVYADTTARDADITSPSNGMTAYITADGVFTDYISGAWSPRATGATVNASETASGKVEIATAAQGVAGTDTGETGAFTVVRPSEIAKNIQSGTFVYGADAGGDDTYVVALTPTLTSYTAGQVLTMKVTTANTGACTVDFGPGVKNIKTQDGLDPATGAVSGTVQLLYDGTNFVLQKTNPIVKNGTYTNIKETRTSAASGTYNSASTGILAGATVMNFIYNAGTNTTAKLQSSTDDASFNDEYSFAGSATGQFAFLASEGYSYRISLVHAATATSSASIIYTV